MSDDIPENAHAPSGKERDSGAPRSPEPDVSSVVDTDTTRSAQETSSKPENKKSEAEKTVKELLKDIVGAINAHKESDRQGFLVVTKAIRAQTKALTELKEMFNQTNDPLLAKALDRRIDAMETSLADTIIKYQGTLDQAQAAIKIENELINRHLDITAEHNSMATMFLEQLEQTQNVPPNLRMPTLERMRDQLPDDLRTKYENSKTTENGKEVHYVGGNKEENKWGPRNEIYQNMVEDWLESHIRDMESKELAFEEQPDVYRYLSLYVGNFAQTEGMKDFGKRMVDKLEYRRMRHRAVRVLGISPPDVVVGEVGKIKIPELSQFFRDEIVGTYSTDEHHRRVRDKGGEVIIENHIEKELRNYERMMRILRERREEYRDKFKKREERIRRSRGRKGKITDEDRENIAKDEELQRLNREIKAKEKYITDYYKFGGSIKDGGIDEAYESGDRWNGEYGSRSNDNKDDFFYRLGTVEKDDRGNVVYVKDSKGDDKVDEDGNKIPKVHGYERKDLVANNIEEGTDEKKGSRKKEKELRDKLWARRYAGGTSSLMFRVSREAQLNGTTDFYANRILNFGDKLAGNYLMRRARGIWDPEQGSYKDDLYSLRYIDMMSTILEHKKMDGDKNKEVREKIGLTSTRLDHNENYMSFENLRWGSSELWDDVVDERLNTKDGTPAIVATYLKESDDARKVMWGPDSFMHTPSMEGALRMELVGTYRGTGSVEYTIKGTNKTIRVSNVEAWWIENYDRSLEWLKTEEAEKLLGDPAIGYAQKAEIRTWINSAVKSGMIDGEVRDILLEKHLGTKNGWVLNRMSEVSIIWNHIRHNKGYLAGQALMKFIENLLGYVFREEK